MKPKLFTLLICLVAVMGAQAYDFSAEHQGKTIYYNITSSSAPYTVEVGQSDYSGGIVIPKTVSYDGITYSVTSIGDWAFEGCIGLTDVAIPNSVTSIGDWAFYDCSSLTSVTIPNSVTLIGEEAFNSCSGLTEIIIGNSVTSIGDWAFYDCSSLTEVTIPNSVTSIDVGAFAGCNGLTAINVDAVNLQYSSIDGVLYNKTQTELIQCPAGKTGSFIIPNSVTSIGDWAFYDCSSLTEVIIPNSVTLIGEEAFNSCSGLTSVTIPNSVTSIGEYAFAYCNGLTEVVVENPTPPTLGASAFHSDVFNSATLYVPDGSLEDYKAADEWKNFKNIVENVGTGVKEALVGQISVFPNPVKADVFIESDLTIEKVEVYTLNGTMLLQENNFNRKISLANIPQGLYMVIIHTDKGTTVKKIMKE